MPVKLKSKKVQFEVTTTTSVTTTESGLKYGCVPYKKAIKTSNSETKRHRMRGQNWDVDVSLARTHLSVMEAFRNKRLPPPSIGTTKKAIAFIENCSKGKASPAVKKVAEFIQTGKLFAAGVVRKAGKLKNVYYDRLKGYGK